MDAYNLKPFLDGKALTKALNTPPGPWMKEALDVVMAWQLRNPDVKDPEQAIAAVENSKVATGGELPSSLAKHFLKLTVRPLFAKARPTNVTATGRRVVSEQLPQKITVESMNDEITKPWKKDAYALNLLEWVVGILNERMVEDVWHLVVPPLLTLIDDWETNYKRLGAQLLTRLLVATPPLLLERTGLAEVFAEALLPCLSYLPTLTPEPDSLDLQHSIYPALTTLARVRCPDLPAAGSKLLNAEDSRRARIKHLDIIVRKGLIYSYAHCNQYPRIVTFLFTQLAVLLAELGIDSVKHLQVLLPMLTETLSSRTLAEAQQLQTLTAAVKAMQALILNAWPRMGEYKGEVTKGLTLCWLNGDGKVGEEVERLREESRVAVRILRVALGTEDGFEESCNLLIAADGRLSELLVV